MQITVVNIPTKQITDWDSFHAVFQAALGFPAFYGRNMDAWIDCMSYVDDADAGMSQVLVNSGEMLALRIDDAAGLQRRCPDQYSALVECTAFVNYRRVEIGGQPILALILSGWFKQEI
ncbi:MAG: barstar family protein [Devosia sp.]|nr:barstar family protein [Devosia sp.]